MSQAGPADNGDIVHKNNTVSVLEERVSRGIQRQGKLIIFLALFKVSFITFDTNLNARH